jgi:hypothetical protein
MVNALLRIPAMFLAEIPPREKYCFVKLRKKRGRGQWKRKSVNA